MSFVTKTRQRQNQEPGYKATQPGPINNGLKRGKN